MSRAFVAQCGVLLEVFHNSPVPLGRAKHEAVGGVGEMAFAILYSLYIHYFLQNTDASSLPGTVFHSDTFVFSELCDHCKKIPFAGLACPTSSEIQTARRARLEANRIRRLLPLEQNDEDESDDRQKIPLGSLERIKNGATYCGVCRLIYGVISRQGAVYNSNKPIPTDQQSLFFAVWKLSSSRPLCIVFALFSCVKSPVIIFQNAISQPPELVVFSYE
jgi:hypothetical protein